jgi:hypothetical protein
MSTPVTPPLAADANHAPGDAAAPRKHGFWFWLFQLVPPLLLLPVLLITDGEVFYYGLIPPLVFALYSVLSLALRLLFLLFRRGELLRAVRPLLTLAVFAALYGYGQMSIGEARAIAGAEAERLQAECSRVDACPEALSIGDGRSGTRRRIGTPSTRLSWVLTYRTSDTGFELVLHEAMDAKRSWTGGAAAPLQLARIDDGRSTPLRLDASR